VPNPSEFVLRFLQSVGRTEDSQFYLKLFQQLPKPSFAFIATDPDIVEQTIGSISESLRFLAALELFPVFAVGLMAAEPPETARQLFRRLRSEHTPAELWDASGPQFQVDQGKVLLEAVSKTLNHKRTVVLDFGSMQNEAKFEMLARLLVHLGTRKLVLLKAASGIGPRTTGLLQLTRSHRLQTDENGINVINLRSDLKLLEANGGLDLDEIQLLRKLDFLHSRAPSLLTSVTSPLNLLRELFTVRGAGTLIKTGSAVQQYTSYSALDYARLVRLLEETFSRSLRPQFHEKEPLRIYLEAGYRGAAIVYPGINKAAYLTKFAVDRRAQGEGIGRDLWEALVRDFPVLYWRARTQNPISAWYATQCDGMHQIGNWRVFWRGIPPSNIQSTIREALSREQDLIG
jgi:GNAT superfamily N-acetyltransferase